MTLRAPFDAPLEHYRQQAVALLAALNRLDDEAISQFKWEHPRFRDKPLADVRPDGLGIADAKIVVAHNYAFEQWTDLAAYCAAVSSLGAVKLFETAVEAVVSGEVITLRSLLSAHPELVRARSTRRHHASLLHYVAANGVENARQQTPANAVEVATLLLEAGAEVDGLADMYDNKCTTMSMLVSSAHPDGAGLQSALAETLLDHGAALDGPGTKWTSALMTALVFGYADTAATLRKRGARVDNVAAAAGLGRLDDAARLLPQADAGNRHRALALAAQFGHADVVRLLLDAGEDPNRYNPEGYHAHGTPLHHASLYNHLDVVQLLVTRGAQMDIRDSIYLATPLGWALHGGNEVVADYLRSRGAS